MIGKSWENDQRNCQLSQRGCSHRQVCGEGGAGQPKLGLSSDPILIDCSRQMGQELGYGMQKQRVAFMSLQSKGIVEHES